jgi:dynein heavy chain
LDMINLYLHLLNLRRSEVTKQRDHLLNGLTKLKETKEAVANLRLTLEELRPKQEKQTQEMMEQEQLLAQQAAVADKQQKIVEAEQKVVAQQTNEVKEVQEDAKHDLQLAMPAYNAAVKAVSRIKPDAVAEMRRLANPPPGVRMTMEAINVLLGEEPDWEVARSRTLTRTDFLKALKEYPRDEITPAMIKKLQPYYDDVELSPERLGDVSKSAQSLMVWVRAMVEYNHVSLDVAPKREKVEKMTTLLNAAMGKLKLKQQQLDEIQGKFTLLKARYQKTLDDQKSLTAKKLQTENRLRAAEKLTGLLAGEQVRWKADAEQFNIELSFLVGDCFISAACVGYYGPFTGDYRARLVTKWLSLCNAHHVPVSPNFSLQSCLGNAVEIREWMAHQLPTDDVSVDSAIIVKHAQRWPLIIDPQEQAKRWIKTDSSKRGKRLVVLRFNSDNLMRVMETAIRTGTPVLIEDCGQELDHAIDGILAKNIFGSKSGERMIYLGETAVPYNDKFQLFMTTKIPNPHYLPEICIKVTLLNFTVTTQGLEDQLLGEVVRKEKWEIEKAKDDLVTSLATDRKQLSTIEEDIIHMVSETKTMDMLDNPSLITALEDSKKTSAVISLHIAEAQVNQKSNQEAREEYRPVAHRGSILYFVISELALIDPMYQYSLTYFMRLFNLSIDHAERSDIVSTRLANLMTYMTRSIYMNVSRGCFESHKLLFSFLIAIKIYRSAGEISDQEWNALLRDSFGATSTAASRAAGAEAKAEWPNPAKEIVSSNAWEFLGRLENALPSMRDITRDWTVNFDTAWKAWLISDAPHKMKLPGKWDAALTPFQKLLLVKTFRSEKLLLGFKDYVDSKMGREFVDFQAPALEDVFKDTDSRTPVIFVLSQGADPTSLLFKFAKDRGFMESKGDRGERLKIVSLGQGQEEIAKATIEQAKQRGEWVLLQNCHLAKSFMPALENMVEKLSSDTEDIKLHDDFRLWLTSMPYPHFPVTVLQKGVKLTNEPPKGLKANLLRSFTTVINADDFEHIKKDKEQPWKKLAFGLCFFHAVIQERKKFGSLGWNKTYEFNDSDLETAFQVLKMFLEEQSVIPWDALRYMCGQINYGGRVTDDWDRRCLMSILNRFFTPAILNDKYRFCALPNYYAPPTGPYASYVAYLNEKLGSDAEPEVFGMHENANLTSQRQETNLLLSTILSIQPREASAGGSGGGSGGKSGAKSDHQVLDMVRSIEEKMPELLDRKKAGPETFPTSRGGQGMVDSLGTVLLQEMDRFNILLNRMAKTLVALRRAIAGEVLMSSELDLMYQSLLNGSVPEVWSEVAYPSLKPLSSWYTDLRKRMEFMREWLTNGPPNAFWLSGFFFPQVCLLLHIFIVFDYCYCYCSNWSFVVIVIDIDRVS